MIQIQLIPHYNAGMTERGKQGVYLFCVNVASLHSVIKGFFSVINPVTAKKLRLQTVTK